jgi:hypothetical protein
MFLHSSVSRIDSKSRCINSLIERSATGRVRCSSVVSLYHRGGYVGLLLLMEVFDKLDDDLNMTKIEGSWSCTCPTRTSSNNSVHRRSSGTQVNYDTICVCTSRIWLAAVSARWPRSLQEGSPKSIGRTGIEREQDPAHTGSNQVTADEFRGRGCSSC